MDEDSGASDVPDAGDVTDASDAGEVFDAGPTCDLSQCPDPSHYTPALWANNDAVACCTEDGACGVLQTNWYSERECFPLQPGEPDSTCLDVLVDGVTLEGCCNDRGLCGHQDPELGCHMLFSAPWEWELRQCGDDGFDPPPPNPFSCKGEEQPCTYDWECCDHPNYTSSCFFGGCAPHY